MKYTNNSQNSSKKIFIPASLIFLLLTAGVYAYSVNKLPFLSKNQESKEPYSSKDELSKTTSEQPSAQEDFTGGDDRDPGSTNREDKGRAAIKDNDGIVPDHTDISNPITSNSGEITTYSPKVGMVIKSGQSLIGVSSLPVISYRVLDDATGMIAMGQLRVVAGKFSGNIEFETSSTTGRLDIFATRWDGSEYSNIEIPIKFK